MKKKEPDFQLRLPIEVGERLKQVAANYGILWGQEGNVTRMLKLLASGELCLTWRASSIITPQGSVLIAAAQALVEKGNRASLRDFIGWVMTLPGVESTVVEELKRLEIESGWVELVEEFIRNHQPFILKTPHSSYHCHYGDFGTTTSKRQLRVWCEQTGDETIPQLAHNHCFELNRRDIKASPLFRAKWRYRGLDTVDVTFRLGGEWAKNYQPQAGDIKISADEAGLVITKKIWSTTITNWFS
jgi:hypothetical protein